MQEIEIGILKDLENRTTYFLCFMVTQETCFQNELLTRLWIF